VTRGRRTLLVVGSLVVVAVLSGGAYRAGQLLDPSAATEVVVPRDPGPLAGPPPTAPASSTTEPAPTGTEPPPTATGGDTTTTLAAEPAARRLTFITRDVDPGPGHDRVYLVPGQLTAAQARSGLKPVVFVRPGQLLRVHLDNRDSVDHTWTFAGTRINVTAWAHTDASSQTFRAPQAVGTYEFFCAFRKLGMDGRIVVTR
jgi:hypothetical protein